MSGRRKPTSTSTFGVGRRESHDASTFYARFTPPVLSGDDAVTRSPLTSKLVLGDARSMDEVDDASVALVVTSPPYFAGKEYEEALGQGHVPASYLDYLHMLTDVFAECVRTLEPGGRIAVNVANLGRKPYRSLSADVIGILQDDLGLLLRGEVDLAQGARRQRVVRLGLLPQPDQPGAARPHRARGHRQQGSLRPRPVAHRSERRSGSRPRDPSRETSSSKPPPTCGRSRPRAPGAVGHPAPFPVELPQRLIELYTFVDDLVLDPFMGSGTTAVAAQRGGRRFVGYDTESSYVEIAEQRIQAERDRLLERPSVPSGGSAPTARPGPPVGMRFHRCRRSRHRCRRPGRPLGPRRVRHTLDVRRVGDAQLRRHRFAPNRHAVEGDRQGDADPCRIARIPAGAAHHRPAHAPQRR